MLKPSLYFKDNAKLASSILTTINSNITSAARDKSTITYYKNAVSFSFKDDDYPLLPCPAFPNHHNVSNTVVNATLNIIKSVQMKKVDFRHRPGTSNVCNNTVCERNVMFVIIAGLWHLITSTTIFSMFVFHLVVDLDSSFHK